MSTGAVPLVPNNGKLSPQVQEAIEEARERWLKTTEVTDIIANYEQYGFPVSTEAPVQPPGQAPRFHVSCLPPA